MELRSQLPDHAVPDEVRARPATGALRIEGLVAQPRTLSASELAALPRRRLEAPFACEEGWTVPGLRWGGVALADVLATAQPLEQARFVSVGSAGYTLCVSLGEARDALLCDTLDDRPLPLEHGGPWRLVLPGGQCFSSVKWVDRLELSAQAQPGTAERIARRRLARR